MAPIISRFFLYVSQRLLIACEHPPPYLPSHPSWEMFPRASSPSSGLPRAVTALQLPTATGDIFLGCWGTNTIVQDKL